MFKSCWISVADLTVDMEKPVRQEYLVWSADPETAHNFAAMMRVNPKDLEGTCFFRILMKYAHHGGKVVRRFRIFASYQVFLTYWSLHIHCQIAHGNPTAFEHLLWMIWDSNPDTNYFAVQIQLHFDGFVIRPFAFTRVADHTRIHLLQSDFSLFIWTMPSSSKSRRWKICIGIQWLCPNEERKIALQQVDSSMIGNPCKCKRSILAPQNTVKNIISPELCWICAAKSFVSCYSSCVCAGLFMETARYLWTSCSGIPTKCTIFRMLRYIFCTPRMSTSVGQ